MSNKNNNQNRNLLDQQRIDTNAAYNPFLSPVSGYKPPSMSQPSTQSRRGGLGNRVAEARPGGMAPQTSQFGIGDFGEGYNNQFRDQVRDRYSNSNNFLPPGMSPNANGWFNLPGDGGSSGGAAGGDFGQAKEGYSKFAETGGINRADFAKAQSGFGDFASGGGVDATALRRRATGQIPAFYDQYKQAAKRRQNVQGGYGPGFDAQISEIGRLAGREGFNTSRQVEGDIADKVQQGRMFGISGQGNLASNIAGMEQSGRLSGLGGLTNIGGMEQQNSQFNAGLGESRAARNQGMQMDLARMYQQGGQFGASGLSDLYGQGVNESANRRNQYLSGLGAMTGNNLNNIGMRSNIQDKSFLDQVMPIAGMIGGGLPGLAGAALKRKKAPRTGGSGFW